MKKVAIATILLCLAPLSVFAISTRYGLWRIHGTSTYTIAHSAAKFLNSGLVGYWTMNGTSINYANSPFTLADVSGNGHTATSSNLTATTATVPGITGSAFSFNGTNQALTLGTYTLATTTSISFWVQFPKTLPTTSWGAVTSSDSGNVKQEGPYISCITACATQVISYGVDDGNGIDAYWRFTWTPVVGQWYHIAITQATSSAQPIMYLNSVSQSVTLWAQSGNLNSLVHNSLPMAVGRLGAYTGGNFLKGNIDEVRLYSRVLSQTEVTELYKNGL